MRSTNRGISEQTFRVSGDAALRTYNRGELDRTTMVAQAGNESDPKWSCLGDAIIDKTAQNILLADIDATIGDFVYTSARKLGTALSYQINKTAKDGRRPTGPVAEMLNRCIEGPFSSAYRAYTEEDGGVKAAIEQREALQNGGSGLWLNLMDSVAKYTTKGKFLALPLSFKSAYTTALTNMSPLVMHSQLRAMMEKNELFSTIDGPYDPFKPIVATDKAGLVIPFSLNDTFKFVDGKPDWTIWVTHYENMRNKYNISNQNSFVRGLYDFFTFHGSKLANIFLRSKNYSGDTVVNKDGSFTIHIPMVSATTGISLWDLIVCSSVPYMVTRRKETFTEVLKYERNFGYPYSGCEHLDHFEIKCDNFSFTDVDSPLSAAIAKPVAALKVMLPEIFWIKTYVRGSSLIGGTAKNVVISKVVLPHYFCQTQFRNATVDGYDGYPVLDVDGKSTMAYPSVRSGQELAIGDTIYGMTEEQYRLALYRMVVFPGYNDRAGSAAKGKICIPNKDGWAPSLTYKYSLSGDGQPVVQYIAYTQEEDLKTAALTIRDVLSTPREMGYVMVAPAGYLTPRDHGLVPNFTDIDSAYLAYSGPSFRATVYHAEGVQSDTILNSGSTNIDVGANLRNLFDIVSADPDIGSFDNGTLLNLPDDYVDNKTSFRPFVLGSYDGGDYNPVTGTYSGAETQDAALQTYSTMK